MNVCCNDYVGMSVLQSHGQLHISIDAKQATYDANFLKACVDSIMKTCNPKKPYFFCDDNLHESIIIEAAPKQGSLIFVTLRPLFDSKIYKLKFVGIIDQPIFYICSNKSSFDDIKTKLACKYKNCRDGNFFFNDEMIDRMKPIDRYGFKYGNSEPNEIIYRNG